MSNSDEQEVLDSIWTGFGKENAPAPKNDIAEDEDPQSDELSMAEDASEGADDGFSWASCGEEGGMIELAAVFPAADPLSASAGSSVSVGNEPSQGVQEIRMDKGVGRFQAFELATVPAPYVDGSRITAPEVSEPVPPVAKTASTSTPDVPTIEASASADRGRSEPLVPRAAAAAATVLGASLVTAVEDRRREETPPGRKRRSRTA